MTSSSASGTDMPCNSRNVIARLKRLCADSFPSRLLRHRHVHSLPRPVASIHPAASAFAYGLQIEKPANGVRANVDGRNWNNPDAPVGLFASG